MTPTARSKRAFAIGLAVLLGWVYVNCAIAQDAEDADSPIKVYHPRLDDSVLDFRRSLSKGPPALRGFRAPLLEDAAMPWPIESPDAGAPAPMRRAADLVARRLAKDGLLATTAAALELLGPANFVAAGNEGIEILKAIGLPVDLLAFFPPPDDPPAEPYAVVRHIARRLATGPSTAALRPELDAIPFRFAKSRHDFQVATESGQHDIGTLRLQLPIGSLWRGPGDGSSVDIARQLANHLPGASFIVSIADQELDAFLSLARRWPLARPSQFTVLAEPRPVAQWAQDNGKPGLVGSERAGTLRIATLVPRYASRGEELSIFVPHETFLLDSLGAAGHLLIQSPLLFQGGNLMPVQDPATGERLLLIGEAEVYRNTALGLAREQVLDAFRLEFAVDRCVVLPAVSFHIDSELCVRACGGRLTAFVNDTMAAVKIILSLGVDALEAHGTLDSAAAQAAREHLPVGRIEEFVQLVGPRVSRQADQNRRFPESLAQFFASGPVDSPAGNLQRFLLALDILASSGLGPDQMPNDRYTRGFIRSLQRQDADRRALHRQLGRLGWKIVGVPSLADADRSINYVNGIHDRVRYIIPAYGGFYEPLDRAAAEVFQRELGPAITVLPVLCGESQRRLGAIHCAVSVYPRP
jgi:hypothetical protein